MGLFGNNNSPRGNPQAGRMPMQHAGPFCGNGHPVDPSWDVCPECMRLGLVGGQPMGMMGGQPNYGGGQGGPEKTAAIDISQFQEKERQVVGWLVAQNGPHKGQDFRLYSGKNVLGTAADCDIVVTDPYLSAKHCTIRYENGNFMIIDLDSRNGTVVNQKRISKEDLIDNDTVRLGKTDFKFKSLF